jgi:hypothetical protein
MNFANITPICVAQMTFENSLLAKPFPHISWTPHCFLIGLETSAHGGAVMTIGSSSVAVLYIEHHFSCHSILDTTLLLANSFNINLFQVVHI